MSPLLFDIHVVTNDAKEDTLQEVLYADYLVFIAEKMAELPKKHIWKRAFECNGRKVNLVKERLCNIGWIRVNVSNKQDHVEFLIEKH